METEERSTPVIVASGRFPFQASRKKPGAAGVRFPVQHSEVAASIAVASGRRVLTVPPCSSKMHLWQMTIPG